MGKRQKILLAICIVIFVTSFFTYFLSIRFIYQKKYSDIIEIYSKEHSIDCFLIYAMIKAESNFKPDVKSSAGAIGLMQLLPSTAEEVAKKLQLEFYEEKLFDPEYNIKLGIYYFDSLYEKYQNIGIALAAYNAGSGNVDKWLSEGIINENGSDLENIPFDETNVYVRKILRDYDNYKKLYD